MIRAYVDPIETTPGGTVTLHARALEGARAVVQKWTHGDPHPAGPGEQVTQCSWGAAEISAADEGAWPGSYATARIQVEPDFGLTVCAWVYPTDASGESILLSWVDPVTGCAAHLVIRDGTLALRNRDGATFSSEQRIRERRWHFVGACWQPDGAGVVFSAPWGRTGGPFAAPLESMPGSWGQVIAARQPGTPVDLDLALGSDAIDQRGAFDGKVAGLSIFHSVLDIVQLMDAMNGHGPDPAHDWDFGVDGSPDEVPSRTVAREGLALHQAPSFSGQAPMPVDTAGHPLAGAGSVHFHRDDLADCGWPIVHQIDVPTDAEPGFYCIRITSGSEELDVPFVVQRPARVSLLASTLTWQAYGNLGRDPHIWPGRSHYSLHGDGSPV
ncbi:MAG: N,N-dimethylformamidase beta subunit family domain-containing protein, partial [Actinomycetales bacterium]